MPAFLHRITRPTGRVLGGERLVVKRFRDASAMYRSPAYRSGQWKEGTGHPSITTPGTYAMAGGIWRNVRELGPLAHL